MNRYFKLLVFGYISAVIFCFVAAHAATPTWGTPKDVSQGAANGVEVMDAGDINGDGRADVAVAAGDLYANAPIFAWFQAPSTISGTWTRHNFGNDSQLRRFLGSCILHDFDGDGDLDYVVSSDQHHGTPMECDLYVYVNPGASKVTGSWSYYRVTGSTQPWNHVNDIAVDDIDKDGLPDIEYTGYWLKAPSSPRTGTYTLLKIDDTYKNTNQNTKEDLGDIDGDGDLDLVLAPAEHYRDGANHILAWYANPGGTPANVNWTKHTLVTNLNDIGQVKLRDMDDDGDPDIVYGHCFVSPYYTKIMYNNGSGGFTSTQTVSSGKGLYTCGIIDFDGDGDLDISGNENYAGASKPWVYENLMYDGGPVIAQGPFGGTPHAVPGRIEAEHYDVGGQNVAYYDNSDGNAGGGVRTDDVDIYPTTDGGTQYKIGYNDGDEWVEYTVNAQAGIYTIRLRVSTPQNDGTCPVSVDGSPVGTAVIPNTGGWDSFTDVEINNVALADGEQVVKLEILGSGWDLNWFEFEKAGTAIRTADLRHLPMAAAGTRTLLRLDGSTAVPDLDTWSGPVPTGMYIMVEQAGSEAVIAKMVHFRR